MLFSQRKGFKPVKSIMQVDSMDSELRNSLWNALISCYWGEVDIRPGAYVWSEPEFDLSTKALCELLWLSYFKRTIDTLKQSWHLVYKELREYFFSCPWYEVYDFIEFVAEHYPLAMKNKEFVDLCNILLENELSAYRFVTGKIAQMTSEEEIAAIEEALTASKPLEPVAAHIKRGLDLLSDRKSPDYRNSIKESISAVEAICRLISGSPKATLGQGLKEIEITNKVEWHPALRSAFDKLYGYTSDAEGIRHALLDEPNLDFEDAKFMLVSCSAFINYLKSKSSKAGIPL